jgi:hypothetical protein
MGLRHVVDAAADILLSSLISMVEVLTVALSYLALRDDDG